MLFDGDVSNDGASTMQRAGAWFALYGFPEGMLDEADIARLGPQAQPGRNAFGAFSQNETAVGLVLATILLLYLGSRVVVEKK